jgi:hypothetical protein
MRFDTKSEDFGWHCSDCNAYFGLTENEERLWDMVVKRCREDYEAHLRITEHYRRH